MALTNDELQSIVSAVLSAIRTNAKTIGDLTPVTTLVDDDYLEINGGKKVSYAVLRDLILSMQSDDQDSIKTLINKCELLSVSITATESSATISISSNGKTITATIPVVTTNKGGLMSATDKVKLESAYSNASSALSIATEAKSTADSAKAAANNAQSTANVAKDTAEYAKAVTDSKGLPGGLAELNAEGKVPSNQLPSYVDDVVEFTAMVEGVTPQLTATEKKSTDAGCMVVYNEGSDTFLLAVSNTNVGEDEWRGILRPSRVSGLADNSTYWKSENNVYKIDTSAFTYYVDWADGAMFGETSENGRIPEAGKIYTCTSTNKTYRWGGSDLVTIGSDLALGRTASTAFPGDAGAALEQEVTSLHETASGQGNWMLHNGILPCNGKFDGGTPPAYGVWMVANGDGTVRFVSYGETNFYGIDEAIYNTNGVANAGYIYRVGNGLYRLDGTRLVSIAGSATGNCYNVTNEAPLPTGEYYNLETAIAATKEAGVAVLGLQISFAIQQGSWKTYQFVGPNTTDNQFKQLSNWIDLAGMTAGDEAIINVNDLCGGNVYNLSTAIVAIRQKQESTGIIYFKSGVILTYRRDAAVWETKQFLGQVEDINETDLSQWTDFGGGGGSVDVSDVPEEDGKEAFSTGGAFNLQKALIADLEKTEDTDNIIIQGVNKEGNPVGSQIKIPKSSGGGSDTGSSLSIFMQEAALYAAYGSRISTNIAVVSKSYDKDTEILGVVRSLAIVDTTTGLSLWSENVDQPSSTSATDYKFTLDFTDFFTSAARRDFTIVATDADGNVKRRTITVTAVDVTCTCVQTLNYTSASALEVGGASKNLHMYKFANNVSKDGVQVKVEMLYGGTWRVLGNEVVKDSYSHSISIDPKNVFGGGEALEHASYPIRIQGVDIASNVEGNTVYTAVMCVDADSTNPIVSLRFDDKNNGSVRLYDSLELIVAAYTPGKNSTLADVYIDGHIISSVDCQIGQSYTIRKQVQGYSEGDTLTAYAKSGVAETNAVSVVIKGSAIDARLKEGALFGYDFSVRSNSEADHTITDKGYTMEVYNSNWSSNGFGKYLDENCLRVAENVTALIPWAPFGTASVERSDGVALQMAFATNNIKDDESKLIECYDETSGVGFYICGNKAVLFCKEGQPSVCTRPFRCGEKITLAVVVEPSTNTVLRGSTEYSTIKMYINGEEVAAIGYVANSGAILNKEQIKFNGTDGDVYLYYVLAYNSYYEWAQAFQNYLCKLTDTSAMIAEYDAENVLDNQNRPSIDLLKAKGIPYYVVVASQATFDSFDADINTSTKFTCTLFYYHPTMPWRSFKATNVQWRRQGTTSAKRPIKNDRFYLKKPAKKGEVIVVEPLYPDYTNDDALTTYKLFEKNAVRVGESTIPVSIITVKVDYSDSSGANDCGVCDLMNATYRALGSDYMTPAQRGFNGTWKSGDLVVDGLQMNHSTANHPIAAFRATNESLTDAWFHAKGNWKEDKGEQVALGFMKTPGYNLGCLNYGDFIEFFGTPGETLDQTMARFKATEGLNTDMPYLLSQYCGRDYRIMRYSGGEWARTTGSMKQVGGKWVVTGDVLNPVSGYELITYDAMDWFMGVGSVEDMMAPTTTESSWVTKLALGQDSYPAWTRYFECMIDDDQLQADLAMGRKVPYDLYNVLKFCDSVDYSKAELADTWKQEWRNNAWKYMSVPSLISYYTFTDYLAAVDQQAKNMQPMFFLENGCRVENGEYKSPNAMEPIRMYFNKVYDCDTCNGKDNDGGNTIPATLDPATDDRCYAGRGSILWNDLRGQQEMVIDANGNVLTLSGVVATMRNLPEIEGVGAGPFSPQGAYYYFLTKRTLTWPKVISSYDGERKYIHYTGYNDIYYYALQGLGLTSLPRFIEQRWRVRDGYYQTGDFKDLSHVLGGRVGAKDGAVIRFKAAKDGYFGIGNDGGNVTQGMYLKAGEEGVFEQFQHGDNILLYIYQADQMSEIDLSELSIDPNYQFSIMKLAEVIKIGSDTHTNWTLSPGNTGFLTNMNLGDLPFLRELDIRGTEVVTVNAKQCPRLEKVLASGTSLATITLAETSPIETLELPGTITALELVNLPNLAYPGGLSIEGLSNVQRVRVTGCPNVDAEALLKNILATSAIRYIGLAGIKVTAHSDALFGLMENGAIGLDPSGNAYDETGRCSGLTGVWVLTNLLEDAEFDTLQAYFPALELHNSQFSTICYSDDVTDAENITNMDDETGCIFNNGYTVPGHWRKMETLSHAVKAQVKDDGKMHCETISDKDYNFMADGSECNLADSSGTGYDIMKHIPHHWYKGINDFKNQRKYTCLSTLDEEPISTCALNADNSIRRVRKQLADILVQETSVIYKSRVTIGGDYSLTEQSDYNVYSLDVEGMKQVRWPGVNNDVIGAVFLDGNGKVISFFSMAIGATLFDFVVGDYLFTDVPSGAKKFVFTSPKGFDNQEAIAVDSTNVEAIEPDWVEADAYLLGVYGGTLDSMKRIRSVSGAQTRRGTNTHRTNADWAYDENGELTNTLIPSTTMNYSSVDMVNLCRMRGKGYQAEDMNMNNDLAQIIYGILGTRDAQSACGYGCITDYYTGADGANAYGNVTRLGSSSGTLGNIMFGLQNYVGCMYEAMDYVGINVSDYISWRKLKYSESDASLTVNAKWHIFDPITRTEREVQGLNSDGYCIARMKHGRFCDNIASSMSSDKSLWSSYYCDGQYYANLRGRLPRRAGFYAYAFGGLAYVSASYAGANAGTYYGVRLAFRGAIVIDK